jgi:hypothetical protein
MQTKYLMILCGLTGGHIRFLIGGYQIRDTPNSLELKAHTTPETPKCGYEQELTISSVQREVTLG